MDGEEKKTFLEKAYSFLDIYLFNRINIILCGVLAGMSLAKGEAMAACGWLCACLLTGACATGCSALSPLP